MKTVLILGVDGYIGNALSQRLLFKGYKVIGVDNLVKRKILLDMEVESAINVDSISDRTKKFEEIGDYTFFASNVLNLNKKLYKDVDIIVNLAHIPSAPYSMINKDIATFVLKNNFIPTNEILWNIKEINPDIHYITIGTTGEYCHNSNIDIEEGYFSFEHKGRQSTELIYPRQSNSIYHSSKIASTYLIDYLSRIWKLKCTDVMQSVVVGIYTDEIDKTKIFSHLSTDDCFGTVLNRFVIQALIKEPLTIFGEGNHQRGFLTLNDSIQALMLAIENEAKPGKVQTWNQLSTWHSMNDLADMIEKYISIRRDYIPSPRKEFTGDHYYKYVTDNLKNLGYNPTRTLEQEIEYMIKNIHIDDNLKESLKKLVKPKVRF